MRILVTGVTGYIGGRLVPELLDAGHDVRVLARHPERLSDRTWVDRVEVEAGDASDPAVVHVQTQFADEAPGQRLVQLRGQLLHEGSVRRHGRRRECIWRCC